MWPANTHILIPAYKAVHHLPGLIADLRRVVPPDHILIVDDASADGTDALCAQSGIACLVHQVNRGKGAALMTGLAGLLAGGAEWIITMDADGQHVPADLPAFLDACRVADRVGIWIGRREMRLGTMPLLRICSNILTSAILSLLAGQRILDSQCGYRAYNAAMLRTLTIEYPRFEMESEVILKAVAAGWSVRFVKVRTLYRGEKSHIAHVRDTVRWVRAVTRVWWNARR